MRQLAATKDIWVAAGERAPQIVLGLADLEVREGIGFITRVWTKSGYLRMLQELTSGIASREGVRRVHFPSRVILTKFWEPFLGVRRRGTRALRAVTKACELTPEHVDDLLVSIKDSFLERVEG